MKTQCPYCDAQFKTPDENIGKKAKCPKCNYSFTISPFREAGEVDSIVNANGIRPKVSYSRDNSQDNRDAMQEAKNIIDKPLNEDKKTKWLPLSQSSRIGIALSVGIVIIGIPLLIIQIVSETKMYNSAMNTMYNVTIDKPGIPREIERKPVNKIYLPYFRSWNIQRLFLIISPAVCLILRSFRPGLVLWRGALTLLGGFLIGLAIPLLVFSFINWTPVATLWIIKDILTLILAILLLRVSFGEKGKPIKY